MIVFNRELLQEENDRLEQFCNNLDNTSTSFAESFPNYDPNDGIYFIKFFSNAVDWFKNTKVGKAEIKKKNKIATHKKIFFFISLFIVLIFTFFLFYIFF